jgi:microcin C transport system substrate-binding protein
MRPLRFVCVFFCACAYFAILEASFAASKISHGISIFGDLKYDPDFEHFEYVNPNAPKGGRLRLAGRDSFDNLNPFIFKGVSAQGVGLLFDTLMTRATDEPDALYGLIAESIELDDDRQWVAFNLRKEARWHDGSPVTAEDVVFTFNTLVKKGHPVYRLLFAKVAKVKAEGHHRVQFTFKPGVKRGLPVKLAAMPVVSKAYYKRVPFNKTTMHPPLGSGPYNVVKIEAGRRVVYRRDKAYWGRHLSVNRGRFNFDLIQWDYFRDRGVAREAFFAGEYDFHEEFVSRSWAKQFDKPAVRQGLIVRETLPDGRSAGVQAFFINLRRKKLADRRVRRALNLAFDFEWTNKHLFFGLYRRTNSMFENSVYAAHEPPSEAELELLRPYRGKIPEEVFEKPCRAPSSTGPGGIRRNLLTAARLLREAGWHVQDHTTRVNRRGTPLEIEFLVTSASFTRILGPYIHNLTRLGINATIRVVDSANFKNRRDNFDFDIAVLKFPQFLTPGEEQRGYFGSKAADMPGSKNVSGLKNPAVDALINRVVNAKTRDELIVAARALDRVVMWSEIVIPHWFKGAHNIAYWNKYERPATKPRYDLGLLDTWWFNSEKAKFIEAGEAHPRLRAGSDNGRLHRPTAAADDSHIDRDHGR